MRNYLPSPPPTEIGEDILPYQLKPYKTMAKIEFASKLKVNLSNNTEIEFNEEEHVDDLPKKDKVLIALALGLGIEAKVREWKNKESSGIVIADSTLESICSKFGILA